MVLRSSPDRSWRAFPTVEALEDRQLLSVTVRPPHINLHSIQDGHGVFTVRLVSDTSVAKTLLGKPTSLIETFTEGSTSKVLTPIRTRSEDVNGDGVADLTLKFRRSDLKAFTAGTVTVTVSNGTGAGSVAELPATFTIVATGHEDHDHGDHGHHGHHGHQGDQGDQGESGDGDHSPGHDHMHS
jgi:hypothetical protein